MLSAIRLAAAFLFAGAELDGKIVYQTADYRIDILLLGSTGKPRIELASDPPLERQEIIALLLFGREPSELDDDQAATVGNTDAALASQAFGLPMLFLLASTPVEYVGYNPETQSYSARLRLPGGASMELGSDLEESNRLRLRKRLARHWVIETELRGEEEGNAITTFIEWFNRY
ncbi:MAG: translocation/assembly module TamB domain-containing protein [Elusimicrobia bacterium]|nr:translocation/assembly module TamB domain-containing protein [Elusimicrobiota bacterium]